MNQAWATSAPRAKGMRGCGKNTVSCSCRPLVLIFKQRLVLYLGDSKKQKSKKKKKEKREGKRERRREKKTDIKHKFADKQSEFKWTNNSEFHGTQFDKWLTMRRVIVLRKCWT